jgi:hypothetical protein
VLTAHELLKIDTICTFFPKNPQPKEGTAYADIKGSIMLDLSEASSSDSQLCYHAYDLAALVLYNAVTVLLDQDHVDVSNNAHVLPVFQIFQETISETVSEVRSHKVVSTNHCRVRRFHSTRRQSQNSTNSPKGKPRIPNLQSKKS